MPQMRVLLASEYPKVRYFLRELVEEEPGVVVIGQAENATKALALARNLRPDVAIIDCNLPHAVGLDTVSLSRTGGLDTAQTISEEIPNTRAIVVTNLDMHVLPEHGLGPYGITSFTREKTGANTPFRLHELRLEAVEPGTLVFANVEMSQQATLRHKTTDTNDKAVLFGGLGILGGLFLMLSVVFAGAGVFLALAGAVTMLLGLGGKLTTSLWPKASQGKAPGKKTEYRKAK